ncbi:MAG: hypothetical protein IPQ26_10770 [Elusimicrobia bacterium]|nr:hypothetical protein [Elusimicrobiota bacterium]
MIGRLIEDRAEMTNSHVPILGRIPLVFSLSGGKKKKSTVKSELVIFFDAAHRERRGGFVGGGSVSAAL